MPSNSIFLGVTTSPARDFAARTLLSKQKASVFMPCAGRFGVVEAALKNQAKPDSLFCSDIGLFSSIIGYLADPTKQFGDLGIVMPANAPVGDGVQDDLDFAANIMLLLKLGQIKSTHQYGVNTRKELTNNWTKYRNQVREKLEKLLATLRGIHYDIEDVWAVIDRARQDPNAALFVNVPTNKGGYKKMFADAEIHWNEPTIKEYDPEAFPEMLQELSAAECAAVVYVQRNLELVPEAGWQTVFAQAYDIDRTDYLIANIPGVSPWAAHKSSKQPVKHIPIYDDEEITPETKISFERVNIETCSYYRDLFVHKLGITKAQDHLLMFIDGRVSTALGFNTRLLRRFQSEYVHEVFGISRSSKRYHRFGKLFMLCLTSGSMKEFLMREMNFGIREPKGIQTTSITTFEEGKTDRSVMKLVHREQLPDGRFRVIYRADFRSDSWNDCITMWLKRWGKKTRK